MTVYDIEEQRKAIQESLNDKQVNPRIIRQSNSYKEDYYLAGKGLCFKIEEFRDVNTQIKSWNLAFIKGISEFSYCSGPEDIYCLEGVEIRVYLIGSINDGHGIILDDTVSWRSFLPQEVAGKEEEKQKKDELLFYDFLRITNQLDILLSDAELFPYRVIAKATGDERKIYGNLKTGPLWIEINPDGRKRKPFHLAERKQSLCEYLERLRLEKGESGVKFHLTVNEDLEFPDIREEAYWDVCEIDEENQRALIQRNNFPGIQQIEVTGVMFSKELCGEIALIKRRKEAIDRIKNHSYLIQAIINPSNVMIVNNVENVPSMKGLEKLDNDKQIAIKRTVSPAYTLLVISPIHNYTLYS